MLEGSDCSGVAFSSPVSGLGSCSAQRCRRSRQLPVKAKHVLVKAKAAAEPGRCPRAAHTQHILWIHSSIQPELLRGWAVRVTRRLGIFRYDNFCPLLFLHLQRAVPMLKNFLVSEQADFPSLRKQQMEGNKHFSSGEADV